MNIDFKRIIQGTFARAAAVTDVESGCLASTFTDYIDGARLYLETESDKDIVPSVREIKSYFSSFVKSLIGSFDRELLNTTTSMNSEPQLTADNPQWSAGETY